MGSTPTQEDARSEQQSLSAAVTMSKTLRDRTILMTGGSSGIGRALLEATVASGADVAVISRRNPTRWELGPPPGWDVQRGWLDADLRDAAGVIEAIERFRQRTGNSFDSVVHCAVYYGDGPRHSLASTSLDEWEAIFSVNLHSLFVLIKACLRDMVQLKRGTIINFSSDVAFVPGEMRCAYASSKAAAHRLCSSLAIELESSNISVIEFLPDSQIDTPGLRRRRPEGFDFSGYTSPNIFPEAFLNVIASSESRRLNDCFVVDKLGKCSSIHDHPRFIQSAFQ